MLLVGIALLLVGFGFKVAAVPFHMWAPDVYDGAPTPITAYMAAAVKAAAFAAFLRVWLEAFPLGVRQLASRGLAARHRDDGRRQRDRARSSGTSSACSRTRASRTPATCSSRIAAGTSQGASAMLFYLLAYTLATRRVRRHHRARPRGDATGDASTTLTASGRVRPWLAVAMTVFMLALLGFPVFGGMGFLAKWYVLQAALAGAGAADALAVMLVLTTVISAGYYLYVVMVMFMRPRAATAQRADAETPAWTQFVMVACAAAILVLGVLPEYSVRFAQRRRAAPASCRRRGAGRRGPCCRPRRADARSPVTARGAAPRPRSLPLQRSTWPSPPASSGSTTSAASSSAT